MKHSAAIGSILALFLVIVYTTFAWWMQQEGFFSAEALFFAAKADMFYAGIVPRLAIFGVTFPLLPFQTVLVLFPFTGLLTPVLVSGLGMAFLFRFLWFVADRYKMEWWWKSGLLIIFLVNPGFLYAAISGQSIYMLLIFFSCFLFYMLTYLDEPSTFSIAMASVFYTGLIFVQFSYVWIFVFILPVILLISIRGVEMESIRSQLTLEILFDDSNRRNLFVRRVLATSFLLLILPAGALALYLYYNHLFVGYSWFFLNNASVNFELILSRSVESVPGIQQYYFFSLSNLDFTLLLLTAVPFATLLLITSLRDPLKVYIVSISLLIVFFHLGRENIAIVNMPLFMLIGISVITAAPMMKQQYISRKNVGRLFLLLSLLSVYFNYNYLVGSTHTSEREFLQIAFGGGMPESTAADKEAALWLKENSGPDKRILADDATTYRVIAFHGRSDEFAIPMENDFITYLSNPRSMASYVIVPSAANFLRRFDLLYNQLGMVQDGAITEKYTEVFRNELWVVFSTSDERGLYAN